jgi:sulfur-carrier protein
MPIVTLRYWAAAKDAAGLAEEKVEALTLADALATAGDQTARLRPVLARSSFLVNGEPAGTRPPESIVLSADAVIEVLPPFAGG